MKVKISPIALIKIIDAASRRLDREVGGFLIGRVNNDYLNIVDIEVPRSKGSKTHIEIDPLAMAAVAEKLEKRGMKESIVGWWHSHPGFGANFMSNIDISTQKVYQSLFDKAVALVIDPTSYVNKKDPRKIDLKIYRVVEDKYEEEDWDVAVEDAWKIVEDGVKLISEIREEQVGVKDFLEKTSSAMELKEEISQLRKAVENLSLIKVDFMQLQANVELFMTYSTLIFLLLFVFSILIFLRFI
ncbi:MAG: Mov34/MPN/PAD-1 family protein [Candidatus Baldrarchaeia archaeon]